MPVANCGTQWRIVEWGGQVTAHSAGNLKYVFSQRSRRVEYERCCSDGWPVTC
jgi:hypothetical protein